MSRVSICIPTYEKPNALKRLLDSIYEQTYKDIEIVISDDSRSTKVKEVAKKYPEIKYFKNKKKLGATANNNRAMQLGNSEYIKIMHHDDWFTYKYSLQKMVDQLDADKSIMMIFSGGVVVSDKGNRNYILTDKEIEDIQNNFFCLYCKNAIGGPSAIMIRNPVQYFDDKLCYLMDVEYFMRLLRRYKGMQYIKEPLISYEHGENRLTDTCMANEKLIIYEYMYLYKKMELELYDDCKETLLKVLVQKGNIQSSYEELEISSDEVSRITIQQIILKNLFSDTEIADIDYKFFWEGIRNFLQEKKYKKIAIYGYGEVGRLFTYYLTEYIAVEYIIDQKNILNIGDMEYYHPKENMPTVDLVIVTVKKNWIEICNMLKERNFIAIGVKDLIQEVFCEKIMDE